MYQFFFFKQLAYSKHRLGWRSERKKKQLDCLTFSFAHTFANFVCGRIPLTYICRIRSVYVKLKLNKTKQEVVVSSRRQLKQGMSPDPCLCPFNSFMHRKSLKISQNLLPDLLCCIHAVIFTTYFHISFIFSQKYDRK